MVPRTGILALAYDAGIELSVGLLHGFQMIFKIFICSLQLECVGVNTPYDVSMASNTPL